MKKLLLYIYLFSIAAISSAQTAGDNIPTSIVIIVNHNLSSGYLKVALLKNKDNLQLSRMPIAGYMRSWIKDNLNPDPYVKASLMATGEVVQPGNLSEDSWGKPLKTLVEYAREKRMLTGLITTSSLTHSSMLAFMTHQSEMKQDEVMAQVITKNPLDIMVGGGYKYFAKRTDKKNLLQDFQAQKYLIEDNPKDVGNLAGRKILALLSDEDIPYEQVGKEYLLKTSETVIANSQAVETGFFFVIENARTEHVFTGTKTENILKDALDFDKAIGAILKAAGPSTLVLVIGDDEVGEIETTKAIPSKGNVEVSWKPEQKIPQLIPVFASGPASEKFGGLMERTDIFQRLLPLLKAK